MRTYCPLARLPSCAPHTQPARRLLHSISDPLPTANPNAARASNTAARQLGNPHGRTSISIQSSHDCLLLSAHHGFILGQYLQRSVLSFFPTLRVQHQQDKKDDDAAKRTLSRFHTRRVPAFRQHQACVGGRKDRSCAHVHGGRTFATRGPNCSSIRSDSRRRCSELILLAGGGYIAVSWSCCHGQEPIVYR